MKDVRITVVKRMVNEELIRAYATGGDDPQRCAPCGAFEDGQTFVSTQMGKPDGFCSWAWADIQRDVAWVALGGVQAQHKVAGTAIVCCTDGLRPVFFHLAPVALAPSDQE